MRGVVGARPISLRAVHWSVWLLLALAVVVFLTRLTAPAVPLVESLAGAVPLVFAAAVLYAAPADRRFAWAALALAAAPAIRLVTGLLPGQWIAQAPVLLDVGRLANDAGNVLAIIGLVLFGVALGGVRSAFGWVLVLSGVLVALANLGWFLTHLIEEPPLFDLVRGAALGTLSSVASAFAFAAAVDALRGLLIVGSGLLFANVVVNAVLLWWAPGPQTNFDLLALVINGLSVAGWLALIAGAMRGELGGELHRPGSAARVRIRR